jgi:cytochrome c556
VGVFSRVRLPDCIKITGLTQMEKGMQSGKTKTTITCVAVAAIACYSIFASAETTPQDAVDYRDAVMTSLKGHIGAASMHVRGLVEGPEFLVKHAQGLANGASEVDRLFPAGSDVEDSEALPVIWEEPEEFSAAIEKLVSTTNAFVEAAKSGDQDRIGQAFRDVGGSCKGCHDKFRESHD